MKNPDADKGVRIDKLGRRKTSEKSGVYLTIADESGRFECACRRRGKCAYLRNLGRFVIAMETRG